MNHQDWIKMQPSRSKILLVAGLVLFVLNSQLRAQVSSAPAVTYTVGNNPSSVSVVAADVNGDGKVDLICANSGSSSSLSVWTNNGGGGFVLASTLNGGQNTVSVTAADVNGDGKVDLICANAGTSYMPSSSLSVFTNDGSGGFVLASSLAVYGILVSVTAADVNGDGKADLICPIVGYNYESISVWTNNGSGGFVTSYTLESLIDNGAIRSVTAADVNGDGKVDLVYADNIANTLSVLTNAGGGVFMLSSTLDVGQNPVSVTAADVNGEGKVDLICANEGDNTLSVLTNDGSGGFLLASSPVAGTYPVLVTAADVNGDGKVDLICANSGDNTLSVLTNDGSGGFMLVSPRIKLGSSPVSLATADVNGDCRPGLICGNSDGTFSVSFNTSTFGPGAVATATTIVTNGFVVAVTITGAGGYGYTNVPVVQIVGGGGSGAQATATVSNGVVTGITILNAGYGYTSVPSVIISPPFVSPPSLGIVPATRLDFESLVTGGGYQLQVSQLGTWENLGSPFVAAANSYSQYVDGSVDSSSYRLVVLPFPTQAGATPVLAYGFVVGATVTNGGSGYVSVPAVNIVGGGGSGAQATATVSNGVVTAINIMNAGFGYTSTTTVQIDPPPISALMPDINSAVRLDYSGLLISLNYQLQASPDLLGWTNVAGGFSATAGTNSQYLDAEMGSEFFRLSKP